ncbi:MAG: PQQ-dependent sugar dehydrogenase [Acidimicrobiales bacterium]
MPRRLRSVAVPAALLLALAACVGGTDDTDDAAPTTDAADTTASEAPSSTAPARTLEGVAVALREIASLDAPIDLTSRPGDPSLYVAERGGRVIRIEVDVRSSGAVEYDVDGDPVLDIEDEVLTDGERGLLGIAFSSDGRKLYFAYTGTDADQHVDEITMAGDRVDGDTRRRLLDVPDFAANHNGGDLALGPDGFLYYSMGDGGGAGDPQDTGQDPSDLLGSILRIDPEGGSADGPAYAIPDGNPFAGGGGAPEVWAYGLRNPWRISFDRATGDLWIGDVGQGSFEEIDVLLRDDGGGRGANLGWSEMEGAEPFEDGDEPENHTPPLFTYALEGGNCAVTGGFVYRGAAIPPLQGGYLYGDFCVGELRVLLQENGAVLDERSLGQTIPSLVSFGEDEAGEVYALSLDGPVYRIEPPSSG